MLSASEFLGLGGPFAQHVSGFAPRAQQQEMAEAVATALANHDTLIAEAGTGTGKTFAYLVPALLSGKKVIVSTGTKALQDQLFHRDLPAVREALGVPVTVALLKGRANYLCLHRLQLAESEGRFRSRIQAGEVVRIRVWAGRTRSGDIAELADIPEDSAVWPLVTSTTDNCLGQECPSYNDCHVLKARRSALEADIVVINHHLFFADLALREEGFGELLPAAQAVILDEAHQLPETATHFFGVTLSSRQLLELARDAVAEQIKEAGDMPELASASEHLEKAVRDLRLALGIEEQRGAWQEIKAQAHVTQVLDTLREHLQMLSQLLEAAAPRGKGLENCWRRAVQLLEHFDQATESHMDQHVHWFETFPRSFAIHSTPLDSAEIFRTHLIKQKCAWIFTSATLTVGNRFEHFAQRMGLEDATMERWDSPFDFAQQALLYLPTAMPNPADHRYTEAVIEAALPVLKASGGRAFLLFTSHRALRTAVELLENRIPYPLLVQGSAPRAELLNRFRALGNAVLLGTSSFWEGVDVRGEALSCVIIDKLPFASPGDPVLQARLEGIREQGGNPFLDYQLPQAVLALKQGVGRLIRDSTDRGVLMLCDPRLLEKSYGKMFFDSLPPMPRTRSLEDVQYFFSAETTQQVTGVQ